MKGSTVEDQVSDRPSGVGPPPPTPDAAPASRRRLKESRGAAFGGADVVPLERMTSRQLIRRAKVIEAVIDAIHDLGPDTVQMRDVAQRSGVALGTAYRYFRSKDHLLAAALEDWQDRLTRRVLSTSRSQGDDALAGVLAYLKGAQRAFSRNRNMTALMLQLVTSNDPDVIAAIDRMNQTNADMFERLLQGFPPDAIPNLSFALNAVLTSAITRLLNGRMALEESEARVEWTARMLLAQANSAY